jgi:SAM-dependent methyltransferase
MRHWDLVYAAKASDEVSWFQAAPSTSWRLLERWGSAATSFVDVGSGASRLVDVVLDAGWRDVTLVDVSEEALKEIRVRLGDHGVNVSFVVADVCLWQPNRTFDAWHDRAVFHFLVDAADRDRYVRLITQTVVPGGIVVIGTFAADGPTQCSGLPTARYDPEDIAGIFGSSFVLEHVEREEHITPNGIVQPFSWTVLRRI